MTTSTGTRKERNVQTRANEAITEADKEFIQSLKVFAESSNEVAGLAGAAINNSPKTPAGNYLAREGDSMIGPIALGPPVDFRVQIDANETIDIGQFNDDAHYSSNIELDSIQPNGFVLNIIANANFDGQILIMRTFGPDSFTINQGNIGNGGNIQTPDGNDFTLEALQMVIFVFDEALVIAGNSGGTWRLLSSAGGGGGNGGTTGTFISSDLTDDQTTNLAVDDHLEFDRNTPPTGADGGIVLQTGAGQLDGIFELIAGKTYFLTAAANPIFSGNSSIELVWYDITNSVELGRRAILDDIAQTLEQQKNEIIFTPVTNVEVELRIVVVNNSGNFSGFQSEYSFASIFEFSGISSSEVGAGTWKFPARAKSTIDIVDLDDADVIFDDVTLVEGDRVLLVNQEDASQNGLYQVGVVTAGFAELTRPDDFDTSSEVVSETFVAIEEGTQFKNQLWHLITNNPITIDTTDQNWKEFGGTGIPGIGNDGKDGTGTFVLDGRMFAAIDKMKIMQQNYGNIGPTYAMADLLYIPADSSVFNNQQLAGNLIVCGRMDQTPITTNGAISSDYGETWTANQIVTSGLTPGPIQFAYDPDGDVAICIVSGGTLNSQRVRRSTDKGVTWGSTAYAGGINFTYVIWSSRLSLFVAITAALTNSVYTSPDGNTWTNRTTAAGNPDPPTTQVTWNVLDDAPALGKLVVVADRSLDILTSTDGITWILEAMGDVAGGSSFSFQQTPKQLIWSEGQEQFLCKPSAGAMDTEGIFLSSDGINWTQHFLPNMSTAVSHGVQQFRWMAEYSIWIGIGLGPINYEIFWISSNGSDWITSPTNNFRRKRVDTVLTNTFNVGTPRALAYSPEFGYVFGIGNLQEVTGTADFDGNRFWRTEVYFQAQLNSTSA